MMPAFPNMGKPDLIPAIFAKHGDEIFIFGFNEGSSTRSIIIKNRVVLHVL